MYNHIICIFTATQLALQFVGPLNEIEFKKLAQLLSTIMAHIQNTDNMNSFGHVDVIHRNRQ